MAPLILWEKKIVPNPGPEGEDLVSMEMVVSALRSLSRGTNHWGSNCPFLLLPIL